MAEAPPAPPSTSPPEIPDLPDLLPEELFSHLPGYRAAKFLPFAQLKPKEMMFVEGLYESCAFKTAISGASGFVFGPLMALFTAGMSGPGTPGYDPTKQTAREVFRDMKAQSWSMAKNFALFGAVFAATECFIETQRAKSDRWNSISAGCATGAMFGLRAGVQAGLGACVGFAAFSAVIDQVLHGGH
eukprot:Colp12_sorted_trinity150504_noHs@19268